MNGAGCNPPALSRVLAAGALLASLWAVGGALIFLIGPVISALPTHWGALAGALALALQLAFGERLVRSLLRLSPAPDGGTWIDEERPFLLALGAEPQLVPTRGLREALPDDVAHLEGELAAQRRGPAGALLTRALALPCLLRAFHAVTQDYGRLRSGTGPLYVLGEAFLLLARLLEAPLRVLHLPPPGPGEAARLRLEARLAREAEAPAWMEALGPLAPVTREGARRRAQLAALAGGVPDEEPLAAPRRARQRDLPLLGFLAGLVAALVPGGPLAAPVVFFALGLALRTLWQFPRGEAAPGDLETLARAAAASARAVPIRLSGSLGERPPGLAVPPGTWLATGGGHVRLNGLRGGLTGDAEVTGWMLPDVPEIVVGEVFREGRRHRLFPLTRRLLVPLELALLGGAWWMLQWVGL